MTTELSVSDALAEPEYRVEGHLKVTGRARYAADVRQTGMLHAVYVRSPYAHARIRSIDTSRARAVPGVHAVLTGADLPDHARFGRRIQDWPVLARTKVLFVGDRQLGGHTAAAAMMLSTIW